MFALQNGQAFLLLRALHAEAKIPSVQFLHSHETERQENQARFCLRAGHETLCLTGQSSYFYLVTNL
jgi:hypothetical protein